MDYHETVTPSTQDIDVYRSKRRTAGSSIKDVATHASISTATVPRAVNMPERVSASTLARVQAAMDALHYRPNALGRQLRAERTGLLGVVLPSLVNPVFAECMRGIEEATSITDQCVMLMTTVCDRERGAHAVETMPGQRVDGLILIVGDTAISPHLDRLDVEHAPYVLVYNDTVGQARIPAHCCATVDNRVAARGAIRVLLAQGHRQIRMPTGMLTVSNRAALRHNGYRGALEAAGTAPQPSVEIDFNADAMLPAELARLLAPPCPIAIFCSSDRLTLLIIHSLYEMGLRVPEDVNVVGFDGLAMGRWLSPTLAIMAQPHRRIDTNAVTALARRIADEMVPSITLPYRPLAGGILACAPTEASLSVASSLTPDTQGASR